MQHKVNIEAFLKKQQKEIRLRALTKDEKTRLLKELEKAKAISRANN